MKEVQFDHPHQRAHFEFFAGMEMPHYSVTGHVDFSNVYEVIRRNNLHFSSVVLYLICKAANSIPQFKRRIRGEKVVEHQVVHPSFTVNSEEAGVFSFCYVDYGDDFLAFSARVVDAIADSMTDPSVEDEPGRDDFLFLSALRWVHFTSITHAMPITGVDSVPRITWGMLGGPNKRILPLNVQAHHAVVDGQHVGKFFEVFTGYCDAPAAALGEVSR